MPTIQDHLSTLYPDTSGLDEAITSLIEDFRAKHSPAPTKNESPHREAILITYADQLTSPETSPLATLHAFLDSRLSDLDYDLTLHLLPFYPSSSDDGFSVMDYTSVDPANGTWDDIAALNAEFPLMFDAVFNHASVQGTWFEKFSAQEPGWETTFFTVAGTPDLRDVVRPRTHPLLTTFPTAAGQKQVWTTFSADQADLNLADHCVLLRLLDILLLYVARGARFIRLDAIAFLWKIPGTPCIHLPETHRVIQVMRAVLDQAAPHARLITETNVPHADNVSYFGDGTNEASLVYNFALPPLVLHTLTTGDATKLTAWAKTLTLPSAETTFFNFLASHDGIGVNPARGILDQAEIDNLVATVLDHGGFVNYKILPDGTQIPYELNVNYFDALNDPVIPGDQALAAARFLAAHAIMFALRGIPGIYFHSLFGSRGDREGAIATGINRRINRQKITAADLTNDLADRTTLRAQVFAGLSDLLTQRAANPDFDPHGPQEILDSPAEIIAVQRGGTLCLTNVTSSPTTYGPIPLDPYETFWGPPASRV